MKKLLLFCFLSFISFVSISQVTLTGTSYTQNFDGVGTAYPTGWTGRTGATASALGTTATLTTTATAWNNATGAFKNCASADGLTSSSAATAQTAATDRSLALRQTGAFGDNGGAFVLQLNNTSGLTNLQLSFKLQSLDISSVRTTTWVVDYGVGASPTSFTTISTGTITTGTSSFTNNTITATLGASAFDNASNIWIRIVTLSATSGSGNRATTGIDDFSLTYAPAFPILTATPTSITNLNYTTNNGGPSPADSIVISGSALTGFPADITVTASTNFEVSQTSKTTGFADNIPVPYTTASLANTKIYVRLKAGLAENPYTGTITFSGGGLTSPPSISLSGSVTSVPPPVVTTSGTLTAFSTFVGNPSASQPYTVSGVNLTDNITITAPTGYEIKTGAGAYAPSLSLTQVSGNVATTTIDVRLIGTTIGTYTGDISHTSTGVVSPVNVAVTGMVKTTTPCGVSQKIRDVRASIPELPSLPTGTGLVKTIKGQITGIFGTNKFYMADSTGGIAIFMSNIVSTNSLVIGDSVQVTGTTARFNGEAELITITCIGKLAPGIAPTPIVYNVSTAPLGVNLQTFLDANEGGLVKIIGVNLLTSGSFTASTNYPISACNNQGDSEVRIDATGTTNIPTTTIPSVTQNITGLIGHYITATQTVNILQLFPNKATDFENSAITCTPVIVPASASCGPLGSQSIPADSTLDVTSWNVEWLGNTTASPNALGPTNDAQQMTNVMQILNTMKSDIFCVQEVCDHKLFTARVKTDFPKYKVRCQTKYYSHFFDTPETASSTTFSQKVCFVYDSTVVTAVDSISLLAAEYNYDDPLPLPTPYPNNWASGRLPFMFIGDVKVGGITKQIHFVGLHAKSGSAVADYNRRKQDVIDLKTKLDNSYPNANIIMLGDYNDDLDTSIAAGKTSSYANFVNDNANYKQISRALSLCRVSSTASYPDIIDHFLMSNEFGVLPASGATPSPSLSGIYYLENTINVTRPINYVANYATTTSDHYPVNARFTFKLPTEIFSINSGNWSSPSTWNCNCVPSSSSNVTIDTAHTVTVDVASQVRSLNVKGTINWIASIMLSLGQ